MTKPTSGLCELDLGISEGFRRKLEDWVGGKLFSGMITTLFRGHPEQYLHTLARTHHTKLLKQTLLCRGLGFRGVASPSHAQLASSFSLFGRCCASGSGVLKPSWQHLCLHGAYSVFVLSDHLWFGSFFPVEFAIPAAVAVWGLSLCNFTALHLLQLSFS